MYGKLLQRIVLTKFAPQLKETFLGHTQFVSKAFDVGESKYRVILWAKPAINHWNGDTVNKLSNLENLKSLYGCFSR